ncbi:hypothetical protein DFO73_10162 [Cytobacillus oceanisediminis]|jgi:hypothetical protein|uniref:Lipoprotein n=1 Tax=Cytobacillus oceanisediminis TaxID=665099 RepID=A0A2V3A5H7_9BACI|nr:hypothetical protein [Cytobacillus oceanisediminis]PWW31808.1 hypothetical protein DFO73_10162 [Cytobacillus oceanisediminis]
MRKLVYAFSAVMLLTACGADEETDNASEEVNVEEKNSEENNTLEGQKGAEKPLSVAELDDRIDEGMNIDTYSAEIQSWAEKGQLEMEETVIVDEENTSSADILQLADGFLGVAYDEKEVTEVKMFQSAENAKEYFESL